MAKASDGSPAPKGGLVFIALFTICALILLALIGQETRYVAKAKLFTQPRFWPAVGVVSMVGFGLAHLALSWRQKGGWMGAEVLSWFRALEYLFWFMIYVALVPIAGYLGSTILFTVLLALRQGYRHANQLGAAALLGLAIVLVFKTGLSVKIPGGAIYEYLPTGLRNFMILNF